MSTENLAKFETAVVADSVAQSKLQAIVEAGGDNQAEALAALSREIGTPVTAAEFLAAWGGGELSLDQLDAVAGGGSGDERVKLILPRHLIYIKPREQPKAYE